MTKPPVVRVRDKKIEQLREALRPFAMIGNSQDYPRKRPRFLEVPFEWCEEALTVYEYTR